MLSKFSETLELQAYIVKLLLHTLILTDDKYILIGVPIMVPYALLRANNIHVSNVAWMFCVTLIWNMTTMKTWKHYDNSGEKVLYGSLPETPWESLKRPLDLQVPL